MKEQQPRSAAIKERVVEVVIGDAVVRAGADVDEAHLQRVMRGGAVGLIPSGATGLPLHTSIAGSTAAGVICSAISMPMASSTGGAAID
ncbi:hypothetical protein EKH55_5608 (plasmid) [Sinorhizobium alkalisoli]|nr:hypothetical protein EKH55_5608 [Sinorhizobium alkalisoli]